MDAEQYRKLIASELRTQPQASSFATSASSTGHAIADAIATLADNTRSVEDRLTAFQIVQSTTFSGRAFDGYWLPYRDALRKAATDKDPQLREPALEALSLRRDDHSRDLLLKGLENPGMALVSPAKAIQLLGYDSHGVAVPAARKILAGKYEADAKNEALRVLAKDPKSEEIFASYMRDKSQPEQLRATSASGLRLTNPGKFAQEAQRIVADETESDSVRASCLGALGHLQGYARLTDKNFQDRVVDLEKGPSLRLKAAAQRFLKGAS